MAADIRARGAGRGVRQHCPGWVYLAGPLAGALLAVALAWALRGPPSRAAGEAAQGCAPSSWAPGEAAQDSAPPGPGPARVAVTDAQVEAARMIVEHDRAAGRETATPIRKIAEAAPVTRHTRRACRHR